MDRIVSALERNVKVPVYLALADNPNEECIVLMTEPTSDNGAVSVDRLTVRLITENMASRVIKEHRIKSTLLTLGDEERTELGIKSCSLNGGGALRDADTKMLHTLYYFYITRKGEIDG